MILSLLGLAAAQDYAFPSSAADHPNYYVTAYYDQGGTTDWNCDTLTYSGHRGSDFGGGSWPGMDDGRDVNAAAPGVVVATNDGEFDRCDTGTCAGGGGFGNYVYIQHANGDETIYGHLKQWSVLVNVGDEVDCGTPLGEMGSSGYSTGPHLHFQVDVMGGSATDPFEGACDPSGTPSHWVDQQPWDSLPTLDCDTADRCQPVDTLSCGDVVIGRNDDPGAAWDNTFWGCTDFDTYTGPEQAWRLVTDRDEPITVRLTGLTGDLDLFVIEDFVCDGTDCAVGSTNSATSDEELVYDATAGVEVALVIDGWEGAVTDYTLEVLCDGGLPGGTTTGTGTATGTATGGTTTGSATGGTEPPEDEAPATSDPTVVSGSRSLGCGCATSGDGAFAGLPLLLLALLRRRR